MAWIVLHDRYDGREICVNTDNVFSFHRTYESDKKGTLVQSVDNNTYHIVKETVGEIAEKIKDSWILKF